MAFSRVVLIGFPGCGKTTIGKKLAKLLQFEFIDLDQWFEMKYHITILDYFNKYGEAPFRLSEHLLLEELLLLTNVVISTGGGTPCFHSNMELILENSVSVYIKMSPISLGDRLQQSKQKRPLLSHKSSDEILAYINEVLPEREKYYLKADHIIKGESLSMDQLFKMVHKDF